ASGDDGGERRESPLAREYAALRYAGVGVHQRVPLKRAGVRFGMHAKSLVVDNRVGVVGTHNFDPRGDDYNTESAVVIEHPEFARALAASIRRDIAPGNSWVVARRDKPPVFSGLEYSLAKASEHLPLFDLWPVRYATSYEFQPGPQCPEPLSPFDPDFRDCHEPVGDFPEVNLGFRTLLTRTFTPCGAGLAPMLWAAAGCGPARRPLLARRMPLNGPTRLREGRGPRERGPVRVTPGRGPRSSQALDQAVGA